MIMELKKIYLDELQRKCVLWTDKICASFHPSDINILVQLFV